MPDTMAELGKLPKEALVYSGPTHCNNNPTVNYALKEKRLTVDSALEKRALDNCCYGQTCLLKEKTIYRKIKNTYSSWNHSRAFYSS